MKVIQINEFVKLHDGHKIFYSKYEYMPAACDDINKKGNDAVLIVGGSDRCIYNHHLDMLPKNVKKVFFQNCHVDKDLWGDIIVPLPKGIEISEVIKKGSYAWCGAEIEGEEKRETLSNPPQKNATKFIYANFRVNTNPTHRGQIKDFVRNVPHITWQEPHGATDRVRFLEGRPYTDFVNNILDHQAVICAQGNDKGDNLRIYETLYLSRVALTFNPKMYENLHHRFPTVLISELKELEDFDGMKGKIASAEQKFNDPEVRMLLDFDYWKKTIQEAAN